MSPFTPSRLARLITSDAKSVGREPTLLFAIVMSGIPALCFAIWGRDWDAASFTAFGLEQLTRYLAPVLLVLPAMLLGWVTGMLLLENRDEGALLAVDVTPLGKAGLVAYRAAITAAFSVVVGAITCMVVAPNVSIALTTGLSLLIGVEAVCAAFILPAFARNKVEGLAITKLTNILSVAPLLACTDSPWRYLGGFIPTFWIGELLQLSSQQYLPLSASMALGVLTHMAALMLLHRLLLRRVA